MSLDPLTNNFWFMFKIAMNTFMMEFPMRLPPRWRMLEDKLHALTIRLIFKIIYILCTLSLIILYFGCALHICSS